MSLDLQLRQKAVFVLNGEMERLSGLYTVGGFGGAGPGELQSAAGYPTIAGLPNSGLFRHGRLRLEQLGRGQLLSADAGARLPLPCNRERAGYAFKLAPTVTSPATSQIQIRTTFQWSGSAPVIASMATTRPLELRFQATNGTGWGTAKSGAGGTMSLISVARPGS